MQLHQIRYFVALADVLNFTRAAETCNVSQPSLTRSIRALEEELGGNLIHRAGRHTHLTSFGSTVLPELQKICQQCDVVSAMAAMARRSTHHTLRVGVDVTIAGQMLVPVVSRLVRDEGVSLELTHATSDELCEATLGGRLELAVADMDRVTLDTKLKAHELFSEPYVVVVGEAHPLARKNLLQVCELAGETYVEIIEKGLRSPNRADDRSRGAVLRCNRIETALDVVAGGHGYAFLPQSFAQIPGLAGRLLSGHDAPRRVDVVTLRGRPYSKPTKSLVQELPRCFQR